jgi:hypothetical protein
VDPPPAAIALDDFRRALASAECTRQFACASRMQFRLPAVFRDEAECRAFAFRVDPSIAQRLTETANGMLTYDGTAAARCVATIGATCGDGFGSEYLLDFHLLCADVFRGRVSVGEPCYLDDECGPSAFCDHDSCPGRCRARLSIGAPCSALSAASCAAAPPDRVVCRRLDDSAPQTRCVLVREREAALGATCAERVVSQATIERFICPRGAYCASTEDGFSERTCQPFLPDGAACGVMHPGRCEPGATCTARRRCERYEFARAEGAACDEWPLRGCNPVARLECRSGVCMPTDGSDGAPCNRDDFVPVCEAGLYCHVPMGGGQRGEGVCTPLRENGRNCQDSSECADHHCDDMRCVPNRLRCW